MLCIVVSNQDKWATVLDGKVIGTSKHVDYSIFHFKAHDVAALKRPITKFIWVVKDNEVTEVILADQLKDRGVNYKTAKRDDGNLTEAEQAEVTAAVELARAAPQPKAAAPAKAPAEPPPATITPEAAATGLDGMRAQPEGPKDKQPQGEPEGKATEAAKAPAEPPPAAITPEARATGPEGTQAQPEGPKDEQPQDELEGKADTPTETEPAEDPLSTTKPSRVHGKKRR